MATQLREISPPVTGPDRRQGKRLALRCPAQLFRKNGITLPTTTLNVSNCGFYCCVSELLTPGEEFECFIRLPAAAAPGNGSTALVLACRCRVARVEALSADCYGVGCQIEDYLIVPE
jgi:hypothetical protein